VLQLEQLRESLTGDAPVAKPAAATAAPMIRPRAATARKPRPRWSWRTWLLLCLPLLLLVVVALWAWRGGPRGAAAAAPADGVLTDNGPVQVEALDDDSTPAPPASDVPAADAAMLADPELALAREADFHAWVAAGGPLPVDESQPQPSRPEPATAALETVDAEN
jgi:hypothetical protein